MTGSHQHGFKDHFSGHADQYAAHRPGYPTELFDWLASQTPAHRLAWDCATGSGQSARQLARRFDRVIATDASAQQISQAIQTTPQADSAAHADTGAKNVSTTIIDYRVEPAEHSSLDTGSADLVTVAQAYHWFDHQVFLQEASRVIAPRGVLAVWTYQLARIEAQIDQQIQAFYGGPLEPYWPPERRLVESGYAELDFPLQEITTPAFSIELEWDIDRLMGYLATWSATQRFIAAEGYDPLDQLKLELRPVWGAGNRLRKVTWPIVIRVFRFPG